jgi:hypothetical protein
LLRRGTVTTGTSLPPTNRAARRRHRRLPDPPAAASSASRSTHSTETHAGGPTRIASTQHGSPMVTWSQHVRSTPSSPLESVHIGASVPNSDTRHHRQRTTRRRSDRSTGRQPPRLLRTRQLHPRLHPMAWGPAQPTPIPGIEVTTPPPPTPDRDSVATQFGVSAEQVERNHLLSRRLPDQRFQGDSPASQLR